MKKILGLDNTYASDDYSLYWVEKRENFVKLCFAYTPEFENYFDDVTVMYTKIAEKIMLNSYNFFYLSEYDCKEFSKTEGLSHVLEYMTKVLVPKQQEITASEIKELCLEAKCNFNWSHRNFYSSRLLAWQKSLPSGSIIIMHSVSQYSQLIEFVSCPVDPCYLAIYSVDLYGDGVQNIDWEI